MMADERRIPNQECEHDWEETYSSQGTNEWFTEVYCAKCCTYGEKTNATGIVYWPCT